MKLRKKGNFEKTEVNTRKDTNEPVSAKYGSLDRKVSPDDIKLSPDDFKSINESNAPIVSLNEIMRDKIGVKDFEIPIDKKMAGENAAKYSMPFYVDYRANHSVERSISPFSTMAEETKNLIYYGVNNIKNFNKGGGTHQSFEADSMIISTVASMYYNALMDSAYMYFNRLFSKYFYVDLGDNEVVNKMVAVSGIVSNPVWSTLRDLVRYYMIEESMVNISFELIKDENAILGMFANYLNQSLRCRFLQNQNGMIFTDDDKERVEKMYGDWDRSSNVPILYVNQQQYFTLLAGISTEIYNFSYYLEILLYQMLGTTKELMGRYKGSYYRIDDDDDDDWD